ncbi:skin secretory protein xP2-like [Lepus europaeus]|uniref:skin secretory protein xP2-like n=1 Tax=Lepus europaeus TaxID=9983 RepID=UPI002B4A43CA|nr:skin secretory protein xP2-like [Lepus europaeus]
MQSLISKAGQTAFLYQKHLVDGRASRRWPASLRQRRSQPGRRPHPQRKRAEGRVGRAGEGGRGTQRHGSGADAHAPRWASPRGRGPESLTLKRPGQQGPGHRAGPQRPPLQPARAPRSQQPEAPGPGRRRRPRQSRPPGPAAAPAGGARCPPAPAPGVARALPPAARVPSAPRRQRVPRPPRAQPARAPQRPLGARPTRQPRLCGAGSRARRRAGLPRPSPRGRAAPAPAAGTSLRGGVIPAAA